MTRRNWTARCRSRPDYVALGPIYPTLLKQMAFAPQGLERIGVWKERVGATPLVAIGGLTPERAGQSLKAGADSACVVTDILRNKDPESRTREWIPGDGALARAEASEAQLSQLGLVLSALTAAALMLRERSFSGRRLRIEAKQPKNERKAQDQGDASSWSERRSSFGYEDLLACGREELFGPGNAQLPLPPMLMFDRITEISETGGDHGKGLCARRIRHQAESLVLRLPFQGQSGHARAVSASTRSGRWSDSISAGSAIPDAAWRLASAR